MKIKSGLLYFYIHMVIEIASFFILSKYLSTEEALMVCVIYDFLAFVPQGIFGYVLDENLKYPALLIGIGLAVVCIGLTYIDGFNTFVMVVTLAIASCLVHIAGAERTLRDGQGKMTPAALFVGGGSFGLITGKICYEYHMPAWAIILITLTALLPLLYFRKHPLDYSKPVENFEYSNVKINPILVIVLATFVVAIRSYIGYGIPTSWKKELWQTVLLYVFMGLGKCLGGILIDKLGIKWTILISTLGALPFLIFGDNVMIVSIIGVMFFSMTMAITLAIITSNMKKHPGLAFGMTTIGLFIGTIPTFFFRITSTTVNIILISAFTAISLVLLLLISSGSLKLSSKGGKNNV